MTKTSALPPKKPSPIRKRLVVIGGILALCLSAIIVWLVYDGLTFRPTGIIAFECLGDKKAKFDTVLSAICVVNADGSNRKILVSIDTNLYAPAWSPNGEKLAFSDSINLYFINSDGSGLEKLAFQSSGVGGLNWSKDGLDLLVQATVDGVNGIYLFNIDTHDTKLLIAPADGIYRSIFSHNQLKVYYPITLGPSYSETAVFDLTSGLSENIGFLCSGAAVRPTGGNNLTCSGLGNLEFYDFDKNTYEPIQNWATITSGSREPAWSPDGEFIVYVQTYWPGFMGTRNGELWIMRADGSHPVKLTNGPADRNPAWRPQP